MQEASNLNEGAEPGRLAPEMASLRLLVLDFVRRYILRWGASPSLGEIAHATGTDRKRAQRAVRRLAERGELLRVPGPRGLALPDDEAEAAARLKALGWAVDAETRLATKRPLPQLPRLDYLPGDEDPG